MAYKAKPFLVNEHASYRFADLTKLPDTQLVMLIPKKVMMRVPDYIKSYEAVNLAGRFGADPGDYEWEWISNPPTIRWWRRAANGTEFLFGWALAVLRGEFVELYGMVEVDETSPFWPQVIPEEVANELPARAKVMARQTSQTGQTGKTGQVGKTGQTGQIGKTGQSEGELLKGLYRDFFKEAGMLTILQAGQPAVRRGTVREVEKLHEALKGLLERAAKTALPSELGKQPGT